MKISMFSCLLIILCFSLICPASAQIVADHTQALLAGGQIPVLPPKTARGLADQSGNGDGYNNVEEYLNGTDSRHKIDYANLGNNLDTIS